MKNLGRLTARMLMTGTVLLPVLTPLGAWAGSAGTPPAPLPRTKFVLPGGEILVGQIVSSDGEMYVVRLPRGVALLRKDFPVAVKTLGASGRDARPSPRIKPIL